MPKRNLIWVAVTTLVALGAIAVSRQKTPVADIDAQVFAPLIQVHRLAQRHYYEDVPSRATTEAIRGYLQGLDPYCRYIPADKTEQLDQLLDGRRMGLGIHYTLDGAKVVVLGPVVGGPAQRAGLRGGDEILAIDGQAMEKPTRAFVDELLAGPEGAQAKLLVRRPDGTQEPLRIPREVYAIETVTGLCRSADGRWNYLLDGPNRIAYVRISEFASLTSQELEQVLRWIGGQNINSLVLDLRDNPGGPLAEAVETADLFIPDGLIIMTKGLHSPKQIYAAHRERTYSDIRLVVLVNGQTASAPKVVAGALKRHSRAILVGQTTHGKDVIQTAFPLGNGLGKVTLTTARYYFDDDDGPTPPPAPGSGIAPHRVVELSDAVQAKLKDLRYRMEVEPCAGIQGGGPTTKPAAEAATSRPAGPDTLETWLQLDTQLAEALRLLRTPQTMAAAEDSRP